MPRDSENAFVITGVHYKQNLIITNYFVGKQTKPLYCGLANMYFDLKFISVKPFIPNINIHILLTALHMFLMALIGRMCVNNKTLCLW